MSLSAQRHPTVGEEIRLNTIPGSGEMADKQDDICIQVCESCGQTATSCCQDQHHRKLAISSIICGISCIGILALINSVKAGETSSPERAKHYSHQARRLGIISIVVWTAVVVLSPVLLLLGSYLLTFID